MLTVPPGDFDTKNFNRFYWHQGWEMFPAVRTPGRNPVEFLLEHAGVGADLTGLRVLDIGAWNGCMALECERRGAAEVVALSLEDPETTGFNFLKSTLQSTCTRYEVGTIYNLDPVRLGTFDIVLCFGVIYHLRYPVLGIDNLRRIAKDTLYLESHVLDEALVLSGRDVSLASFRASLPEPSLADASLLQFYKADELAGDPSNWFSPSMSALLGLIETAGFQICASHKIAERGYVTGKVTPGMAPFLDKTYEGTMYDPCLRWLYGPKEQWQR